MSEPIENHAISKIYTADLNSHQFKHRRRFRRDREPSRIPIRSLKRPRNKSRKVREFVHDYILSCLPMSSSVYCHVIVRKQQTNKTFLFSCFGRQDKLK